MASSHVQSECEKWIVESWLPERFGLEFERQRVRMQKRGHFEFDAVSTDKKIVGNISTASAFTYRGSLGLGKMSKLRSDCLMLALATAEKKLMILTEPCMYEVALKEQAEGRLPLDIEFLRVELPEVLRQKLVISKDKASKEMRGSVEKNF